MQMIASKCVPTGRLQGRDYVERGKCFVHYGSVGFVCYCWLTILFTLTIICDRPVRRWQARTLAHPSLVVVVVILLLFPCTCSP